MERRWGEISTASDSNEKKSIFITDKKRIEDLSDEELILNIIGYSKELKRLDKALDGMENKLPSAAKQVIERYREELAEMRKLHQQRGITIEETEQDHYSDLSDDDINAKIKGYTRELRRIEKGLNDPENKYPPQVKMHVEKYREEIAELERVQRLRKKN